MLLGPRLWPVPAKTEQKDADMHAQPRPAAWLNLVPVPTKVPTVA
jgi:hypothetical protein